MIPFLQTRKASSGCSRAWSCIVKGGFSEYDVICGGRSSGNFQNVREDRMCSEIWYRLLRSAKKTEVSSGRLVLSECKQHALFIPWDNWFRRYLSRRVPLCRVPFPLPNAQSKDSSRQSKPVLGSQWKRHCIGAKEEYPQNKCHKQNELDGTVVHHHIFSLG